MSIFNQQSDDNSYHGGSSRQGVDGGEVNLREYLRVIVKNKWLIMASTAVLTGVAALYAQTATPIYVATSTLLIEGEQKNAVSIDNLYGIDSTSSDYFQTQYEILKSRELAERIVKDLQLTQHEEFNGSPQPSAVSNMLAAIGFGGDQSTDVSEGEQRFSAMDADTQSLVAAETFLRRLTVSPVRKTKLVKINFESPDPVFAAKAANAVGEAYIENYLDTKAEQTTTATAWMSERLSGLKVALEESERKLQQYKEDNQLVDFGGGVTRYNEQELANFSGKLIDAQRELAEKQALFDEIRRLRKNSPELLESMPSVQRSSIVQTYKVERARVEREQDELSNKYGDRHPKMIDARSRLAVIEKSLDLEIRRIISSIEKDADLARSNVSTLKRSVASGKAEIQNIGRKSFELDGYQREVDANRNLYDTFFNRIRETDETGSLNSTNAHISDQAVPPFTASKPKKKLVVALAFLAGLIGSLAFAFMREYMDDSVRGAEDIEAKLGLPLLGIIPQLKYGKGLFGKATDLPLSPQAIDDQRGTFSESIRTIRTSVTLNSGDVADKVIMITSSVPNEGKTTLSINLAYSMSQVEKVLLIDADMRRPSVHKTLGLPADAVGLANLVEKTAKAQDCIMKGVIGNLDVMTAGGVPSNPLELISSKRFAYLLEQLRKHYDRVIIDCAPVQAVSDSLVLAQSADTVLYVVRSVVTPMPLAQRGVARMKQVGAKIKGIVVTQVDVEKLQSYGGDHYYQGYYDYYGYSEDNAAVKREVIEDADDFSNL